MLIGVPAEIKNHEYRVGLTPASVREMVSHGHQLMIQANAGAKIGFHDADYIAAGATIIASPEQIFAEAKMIIKVKEPQLNECQMLHQDQILYTYLHLAADNILTENLLTSEATCIAYETVTDAKGRLPLLAPMSEVAGRLASQVGAHHLENTQHGRGILLGGVPGVEAAKVLIIGGGVVGNNAAIISAGMGADITIVDRSIERLRELDNSYKGRIKCIYATTSIIEEYALNSDLIIGAALIPGAVAPKLLTTDIIHNMKTGSVVVDVAIDQGGCFETSKPTTHNNPTFIVNGVVHYCVTNMPGIVARTSTIALNNATLATALALANKGLKQAMLDDKNLQNGLNIHKGMVSCKGVCDALGYEYVPPEISLLK